MVMMTNKIVAMDIETDALDATRIWVICAQDVNTGETEQFLNVDRIPEERERFIEYCRTIHTFVFHNGIGFDVGVINRLVKEDCIDPTMVLDTLILSRLIQYDLEGGHSLKAWGKRLSDFKMDFKDFSVLTQEMIDYCHQDVAVTAKIYKKFLNVISDPMWRDAIRCEHDIQILCEEMTKNGFYFEKDKAEHLLDEIELRMCELEEGFQHDFPPKLEEVNRIIYRKKQDGSLMANVVKAKEKYPKTEVDKSTYPPNLICYDWVEFKPSSPKMRIERLWQAGWKPTDKTKGHIEYDREQNRR